MRWWLGHETVALYCGALKARDMELIAAAIPPNGHIHSAITRSRCPDALALSIFPTAQTGLKCSSSEVVFCATGV